MNKKVNSVNVKEEKMMAESRNLEQKWAVSPTESSGNAGMKVMEKQRVGTKRLIFFLAASFLSFAAFAQQVEKVKSDMLANDSTTHTDLDKYVGVYSSKQIPLKITISKSDTMLFGQAAGQPAFPLEETDEDRFEFEDAGIVMDFNPTEKTMVLKQGGGIFNFVREAPAAEQGNKPAPNTDSRVSITGTWNGILDVGTAKLRIIFHIEEKNGVYSTIMDSPDEGLKDFKIASTVLKNGKLILNIPQSVAMYEGIVKKNSIEGSFIQGGHAIPMNLKRGNVENHPKKDTLQKQSTKTKSAAGASSITGTWSGVLKEIIKLRIVFHITEKDGIYSSTMDSPDQGAKGIPTASTILKNKKLTITIPQLSVVYEGKVNKNFVDGTFTQAGKIIPLTLIRGSVEINRPQTPKPPFPYHAENIYFDNAKAGIRLAGTFTFPEAGGKFPAVVLISGSGAQNRDEEIFEHHLFAVIADHLTRNGIAVLRYDDRGVGESKGVYHTASIQDFSTDALSAVAYLKTRSEVNPQKIGLIGHSEGGTIAFMLAGGGNDIAFIVSLAGSTIKGDTLINLQRELLSKAMGIPDKQIAENNELFTKMCAIIDKHTADSVSKYPNLFVDELIPTKKKKDNAVRDEYINQLATVASPEIYSIIKYDPTNDLQKIKCPVLALNGEKDLQVPADVNLGAVEKYVKSKVSIKKYPNLNHLFQTAKTGLPAEYAEIEETISPQVLKDIEIWIKKITNE